MKTRRLICLAGFLVVLVLIAGNWRRERGGVRHPAADLTPRLPVAAQNAASVPEPVLLPAKWPALSPPLIGVIPTRRDFASMWSQEPQPVLAAFNAWAEQWLAAPEAERTGLVAEGVARARARRAVLKDLIRSDPRQALASAVPMTVRAQLPPEVLAQIEARVSGEGRLALIGVTPGPGETVTEPVFRTAMVGGREYRAHIYGRREAQATKVDISVLGVAVDGALAVSESPLRVLEPGERPAPGQPVESVCPISGDPTPLAANAPLNTDGLRAVEVGGRIYELCHVEHVPLFENRLIHAEDAAGPYPGALTAALTAENGQAGTSGVSGRPPLAWSTGTKKVLIIRVDFSDKTGTPVNIYDSQTMTPEYVANVFNGANGIADYYAQASYGQTALAISAADVTPVYRLPQTAAYYAQGNGSYAYDDTMHTDAQALATAGGFNLALYDRIGVIYSYLGAIPNSKINYYGRGAVQGKQFWLNGICELFVGVHEIGHNYGLQHANLWRVTDGNPVSAAGTSFEYDDVFSLMGGAGTTQGHFSMWEKSILHWIPDTSVTTVETAGTYRVYRFDHASANTANPLALKIVRNATQDYWIGLRKLYTTNASLSNGAYILWGYNNVVQGNLLDFTTPGTNALDAALAVGATFHDTAAGVTIHPLATGGTTPNEYLEVQVDFDPRIEWAAATYNVEPLTSSVTLTLTRTSNSSGAVSVNYATVDGTALAGTHYTMQSGTVSWASGDSAPKTVTIPISATSVFSGFKNFTVSLSGQIGGVLFNGATATVSIAAVGASDPTFQPGFVNAAIQRTLVQPDGKILICGLFTHLLDTTYATLTRNGFARLNANGTLDTGWGNGTGLDVRPVYAAALQPDGKMLIGGNFTSVHGTARNRVARLNVDGSLDTAFNPGTGANAVVFALLLQPDGRVVVGGEFTTFDGTAREYLVRLNVDGSLDTNFVGPDFGGTGGWRVRTLALAPDATAPNFKILAGGVFYFSGSLFNSGLARLSATGGLDTAFSSAVGSGAHVAGSPGNLRQVNSIAVQRDGKIVIGGSFTAFNSVAHNYLARLTPAGVLDDSFTPSADGLVNALLVQADGKLLVGGAFVNMNSTALNRIARLNMDGTIDPAFGVGTGAANDVYDFAMQADGKLILPNFYGGQSLARLFTGLPGLPGTVQFSAPTFTGFEGNALTVTATRSGGSYGAISMNYGTQVGTAAATRYTPVSGTLAWADGETVAKTFTVPILNDGIAQGDQAFTLNLGIPIGGVVAGAPGLAAVTVAGSYTVWKYSSFSAAQLLDPAISGNLADPDGDGLNNLLEYASGTNPTVATSGAISYSGVAVTQRGLPVPWVQTIANGVDYRALFGRRKDYAAAGLNYTVQFSADMGTWENSTATPTVVAGDAEVDAVTVPYPFFVNGRKARFFRVQVTGP